jgi:glycosyltransferase involved in cell wall biosynthesis
MRSVGLNALFLDPGVSGGSETMLRALVPRLVARRPDVRFELVTTRRGARALRADGWGDLLPIIALAADDSERLRRTRAELLAVPWLARRRGWDLVHTLSNRGPAWSPVPSVVTVHDVIFFQHRTLGRLSTAGMRLVVAAAARHAAAVITVSQAAAGDIAAVLGVPRERITAIPHGVEAPPEPVRWTGERLVVNVAAKRPHKNQELLVRALALLPEDVTLVCAGHDEGYGARLAALGRELGVSSRLELPGWVEDLEALWARAACAAFPTLAEGFGLPVLEAMARGVPVACSDLPVLREVAGDAAELFDTHDAAGAAAAIQRAIADREELAARGRERAARFTWDRAADATLEVYERCTSG